MIQTKRIYEPADNSDGTRVLVDGLWPRGVKKNDARIDRWIKEIAPSVELRAWFNHDPDKWEEFQNRYRTELKEHQNLLEELNRYAARGTLTLLYSAKNEQFNNAVALQTILQNL